MIEQIISETLNRIGHLWTLDTGMLEPSEDDVTKLLDEAAKTLYDRGVGDRLEAGGLIIEKRPQGHDVWVYVGNYE